jgi:rhamnulokinase
MWLLRQCIEHWRLQGQVWTVEQLIAACADFAAPDYLFDVDRPDLLLPGDMPARINAQLKRVGQTPIPEGLGMAAAQMANLIFHSLADRYAEVLQNAARITGKVLQRLYVVGGGSRNALLNRLTARATGLEVLTGSTESTTVGNFAIQLAALQGDYTDAIGVSASAVAKWAGVLAPQPIGPPLAPGKQAAQPTPA